MSKYLLIRILGNDLPNLHGGNQTINNLKFILDHEFDFYNTDKIFLLNRIVCSEDRTKIINLLKRYKKKYIELPFNISKFKEIKNINLSLNEFKQLSTEEKVKLLYDYNLYLVNNNGSRNYCIEYGKKNNYEWTFVLDGNSFFTKKSYEIIMNNICNENEYLIIPLKRIQDMKFNNDDLLNIDEKSIDIIPISEPQIAFKKSSKYTFNDKIPYGISPKAEFLNALNVKGIWNNWKVNHFIDIKDRVFENSNFQIVSYVFRLHSFNANNKKKIIGITDLLAYIY